MEIHYSGKVSKNDFLKALSLHNPQLRFSRWFFGAVFLFLILGIALLQWRSPAELAKLAEIVSASYPSIIFTLIVLTFPFWTPYLQAMSFSQKGNIYHDTVHGTIDETRVTINGADAQAAFQ